MKKTVGFSNIVGKLKSSSKLSMELKDACNGASVQHWSLGKLWLIHSFHWYALSKLKIFCWNLLGDLLLPNWLFSIPALVVVDFESFVINKFILHEKLVFVTMNDM